MSYRIETEIAWHEVEKWNPDFIYPMPVGYMARNQAEYIVDGWKIFRQDESMPQDMICLDLFPNAMTFTQALGICELHNKERLVHDKPEPFTLTGYKFISTKPYTPNDTDPNFKRKGKGKWVERKGNAR